MLTDDQVLELAKKIEQQRAVDAIYAYAKGKLGVLETDLLEGLLELRHIVRVTFYTLETGFQPGGSHQGSVEIELPVDTGEDIIKLLQSYISEVTDEKKNGS
jgi:hypothetical protein